MATTDFGLSFTVSAPALWTDNDSGKQGATSTIFASVVSRTKLGATSTIFADIVSLEKLGPTSTIEANLCWRRNRMSGPPRNVLRGPGSSIIECA